MKLTTILMALSSLIKLSKEVQETRHYLNTVNKSKVIPSSKSKITSKSGKYSYKKVKKGD